MNTDRDRDRDRATSNPLEPARALDVARIVAGEAAELLRGAVGQVRRIEGKSNARDLVTEWDTRCEDFVRTRLSELTPGIALLGEERGTSEGDTGEDVWVIDPIDGTVNFAHGVPFFSVAISLERRGQPVCGVVYAPVLGWEFYGALGSGAYYNGERLRVSGIDDLGRALLVTGFPYDRATNPLNNFAEWEHFQRLAGACRRFGSASLDMCMVACGWMDGYWERHVKPWDISAGALLVTEAGGLVTAMDGGPFQSAAGEVVASNGAIHGQIVAELAAVQRTREPR